MAVPDVTLKKPIDKEQEGRFILKSIDLFRKPLMQLGHSIADVKRHILHGDTIRVIPAHFDPELAEIKDVILPYIESGLLYKTNLLPSSASYPDVSSSKKGILLLAESLDMVFDLTYKHRPSSVIGEVFVALPNLAAMVLTVTRGYDGVLDVAAYNASVTRDLIDSLTRFMDESLQIVSGVVEKEEIKHEETFVRRIKTLTQKACSVITVDSLYLSHRKYDKFITAFCASISETKSVSLNTGNTSSECLRFLSKEQCIAFLDNLNRREVYVHSRPGTGSTTLMVEIARRLSKLGKALLVCKSTADKDSIRPLFEATITESEFEPSLLDKYQHIIHETNIAPMPKGRRWTFSTVSTADIEEELSMLDLKEKVADLTKEKFDLLEKMEELKIQLREAKGEQESPKMEKKTKFEYESETEKLKKEDTEVLVTSSEISTEPAEQKDIKAKVTVFSKDEENSNNEEKEQKDNIQEIKEDDSFEGDTPAAEGSIASQRVEDVKDITDQSVGPSGEGPDVDPIGEKAKKNGDTAVTDTKYPEVIDETEHTSDVPEDDSILEVVRRIKTEPPESAIERTGASGEVSAGRMSTVEVHEGDDKKSDVIKTDDGDRSVQPEAEAEVGSSKPTMDGNYQCPICPKLYKTVAGFKKHLIKVHRRPDLIDVVHKKRHIVDPQDPTDVKPAKRQLSEKAPLDITNVIMEGHLMEYNTIKVNTIYCHVTAEKDLVNWPPDTRDEDSRKFVKYRGTCSTDPIPLPIDPTLSVLHYWETETDVELLKSLEWPLLELGVSEESQVDKNNWIWLQSRSWCVRVGDCPTHTTEVCTQVWGDQNHILCHTDTMSSDPGTKVVLTYAVLLDVGNGRLAFLDLKKNICLHKFDVDFREDVFPMFGLWPVPDWFTLRMRLISGPEVTLTEEKKLLIHSALAD